MVIIVKGFDFMGIFLHLKDWPSYKEKKKRQADNKWMNQQL